MKNCKVYIKLITVSTMLFFWVLSFSGCIFFPESTGFPLSFPFRFSIKNETGADLSIKLVIGEIPTRNAGFEKIGSLPREIFQLAGNELWYTEFGRIRTIKPGRHDAVYHSTPLSLMSYHDMEKYISFILTVSQGDEIVFRAVGWDVPDEDMKTFNIDDRMWGFYNTAEENFVFECGQRGPFPFLTSRFFLYKFGRETSSIGSLTYYVRVTSAGTYMEKMDTSSHNLDDQIWRELGRR